MTCCFSISVKKKNIIFVSLLFDVTESDKDHKKLLIISDCISVRDMSFNCELIIIWRI